MLRSFTEGCAARWPESVTPLPVPVADSQPLGFALVLHLHQPMGNFDHVFEEHLDTVYLPLFAALERHEAWPLTVHLSGPLIDWLDHHAHEFLDRIASLTREGKLEILSSGRYEPILAALSPRDRLGQLTAMGDLLRTRLGATPTGAWLTERVWEPDLAADLNRAELEYTLLDDRHLLASGVRRDDLDGVFHTEHSGRLVGILPIDERLRYLIPFRPVEEIRDFFSARRAEGYSQVVLGDDAEKFGGWPGTREWVYGQGWLEAFLTCLQELRSSGVIRQVTASEAAAGPRRGLVYPATTSYREMEEWTLPQDAARGLDALRPAYESGDREASVFIRGGHWRGFLQKYPESNRMHKMALRLSDLCHRRGNPHAERRRIGRAQCNDAYWHGVFGGVYLPHLRQAVWRELAAAEASLREGQPLRITRLDFDGDGHEEIWAHSERVSVLIAPARGGCVEIWLLLEEGVNAADVMARRLEAYHGLHHAPLEVAQAPKSGIASIHHDHEVKSPMPPLLDPGPLGLFQEMVIAGDDDLTAPDPESRSAGAPRTWPYTGRPPIVDWSSALMGIEGLDVSGDAIVVTLSTTGEDPTLHKRITLRNDGSLVLSLDWRESGIPSETTFLTRICLAHPVAVAGSNEPRVTRERVVTLSRSEQGFERVDQGESITLAWPAELGSAAVELRIR